MKFIVWDPFMGTPDIASDTGAIGRIDIDNVYLRAYAVYPENSPKLDSLQVGEHIDSVKFQLSGQKAYYSVYRVE